jgi:hypothetical protein
VVARRAVTVINILAQMTLTTSLGIMVILAAKLRLVGGKDPNELGPA